jgi:predicted dienelactone hydrolase
MVHWASRGFVVLAADHPGLRLGDTLGSLCGAPMVAQDLRGDLESILAAVRGEVGGLEFLGDRIDAGRIGMAGHSAGGNAISSFGGEAQVLVPMAAGGTQFGPALLSTLVLGGTDDSVVQYMQQRNGYASSPSPKRFVGIEGAGHLSFSEICSLSNAAGDDLLTIATDNDVCGAQLAGFLFQCSPDLIADPDAWALIDYATSAAFEEMLQCTDAEAAFAGIEAAFPYVTDFEQG